MPIWLLCYLYSGSEDPVQGLHAFERKKSLANWLKIFVLMNLLTVCLAPGAGHCQVVDTVDAEKLSDTVDTISGALGMLSSVATAGADALEDSMNNNLESAENALRGTADKMATAVSDAADNLIMELSNEVNSMDSDLRYQQRRFQKHLGDGVSQLDHKIMDATWDIQRDLNNELHLSVANIDDETEDLIRKIGNATYTAQSEADDIIGSAVDFVGPGVVADNISAAGILLSAALNELTGATSNEIRELSYTTRRVLVDAGHELNHNIDRTAMDVRIEIRRTASQAERAVYRESAKLMTGIRDAANDAANEIRDAEQGIRNGISDAHNTGTHGMRAAVEGAIGAVNEAANTLTETINDAEQRGSQNVVAIHEGETGNNAVSATRWQFHNPNVSRQYRRGGFIRCTEYGDGPFECFYEETEEFPILLGNRNGDPVIAGRVSGTELSGAYFTRPPTNINRCPGTDVSHAAQMRDVKFSDDASIFSGEFKYHVVNIEKCSVETNEALGWYQFEFHRVE